MIGMRLEFTRGKEQWPYIQKIVGTVVREYVVCVVVDDDTGREYEVPLDQAKILRQKRYEK